MKGKLPKKYVPFVLAAGLILLALVAWLALVHPQQSKASKLSAEIEGVRAEIAQNRQLSRQSAPKVAVRLADVFRLSKAMPSKVDMPGILLELNRVAGESGITFESIAPQAEVSVAGYRMVPIQLSFTGNYYELSDLLYRLRNLVEVHRGELATSGRLFTVDSIHFSESPKHFPLILATLTVNAFVYGGGVDPATGAATAAGGATISTTTSTSTTSVTTAPATTTPSAPPPSTATASGVTP